MRTHYALHYVEHGPPDAPPILFLHGITGSRRYWEKKVRPLALRHRLLIPDLIGFGLSPKPHIEYTMEVYRDTVRDLLVECGLSDRPLVIVGHSLGGLIALNYAAAHPRQVTRMVLFSLPRYADPVTAHHLFWRGSPHYRRLLNEHSIKETIAQLKRSGIELTLRYMLRFPLAVLIDAHKFSFKSLTSTLDNCLLNYRIDDVLPNVPPVPTLLVHGEQDSVAPLDHVRGLPLQYPQMRLEVIPRTGHHTFLTDTRRCLGLIERFLPDGTPPPAPEAGVGHSREAAATGFKV
jgi:pimeloyl-ACP methyl ester carboxylesterase